MPPVFPLTGARRCCCEQPGTRGARNRPRSIPTPDWLHSVTALTILLNLGLVPALGGARLVGPLAAAGSNPAGRAVTLPCSSHSPSICWSGCRCWPSPAPPGCGTPPPAAALRRHPMRHHRTAPRPPPGGTLALDQCDRRCLQRLAALPGSPASSHPCEQSTRPEPRNPAPTRRDSRPADVPTIRPKSRNGPPEKPTGRYETLTLNEPHTPEFGMKPCHSAGPRSRPRHTPGTTTVTQNNQQLRDRRPPHPHLTPSEQIHIYSSSAAAQERFQQPLS